MKNFSTFRPFDKQLTKNNYKFLMEHSIVQHLNQNRKEFIQQTNKKSEKIENKHLDLLKQVVMLIKIT